MTTTDSKNTILHVDVATKQLSEFQTDSCESNDDDDELKIEVGIMCMFFALSLRIVAVKPIFMASLQFLMRRCTKCENVRVSRQS